MFVRHACVLSCLALALTAVTSTFVDIEDDDLDKDDTLRELPKVHEIDNPFPSVRDYRPYRTVYESRPKRVFCPRGFVYNPVSSGCLPSLGYLKGRRWQRRR